MTEFMKLYDSTRGTTFDSLENSTPWFSPFFCRILTVFTVIKPGPMVLQTQPGPYAPVYIPDEKKKRSETGYTFC